MKDPFSARTDAVFEGRPITYYRLASLEENLKTSIDRLPISIKILLEAVLRQFDNYQITESDIRRLAAWQPRQDIRHEIPFKPARVVLQDFTGVPAVVDLAALRSSLERMGHDPHQINPLVPVDLVVDHSVQVDRFGQASALQFNIDREFERNIERYRLLNWAQRSFQNFRVVPPGTGIVHQVNLEYLANVVSTRTDSTGHDLVFPDSVVGTDSHTTMINGLGVLGWGVGGIEAEANMLGQPLYFVTPEVVGMRLTGQLPVGSTATDLALTITQLLRKKGVVGKFVEFYGSGISQMSLADRATVANMAPEYGATMGFFPVDEETLRYLRQTSRSEEHVRLVEWYCKAQGLFRTDHDPEPIFSDGLELDLATVEPSLAGPKRPQDRVPLSLMQPTFHASLKAPVADRGFGLSAEALDRSALVTMEEKTTTLRQGSVVIAAITSCTNTSNPSVMIGAGLIAQKAVARGLKPEPYVKTSLAPGSRVVTAYLKKAGLLEPLQDLGFNVVGYGCTTCIGNSGPLPDQVSDAITQEDLTVAAVLSGNRNFEGRIHPLVKANYLASPPLVVAYALAGSVDIDLNQDPLGTDRDGRSVYLKDLWPSAEEVQNAMTQALTPDLFADEYATVFSDNKLWNDLSVPQGELYAWDQSSTYIQEPPFFLHSTASTTSSIHHGRILLLLGDSVTTDHISPAGSIASASPAAQYLRAHGIEPQDFNSYGARRGNHEVMMRGTFANIRIRNQMLDGKEGGYTYHYPDKAEATIYDASMQYQSEQTPLVIMAGKEYGTGSSRDWAAKGTALLGVKAVIAESFERIHRSNLVGMGVLPLQFVEGDGWHNHNLCGDELVDINIPQDIQPGQELTVTVTRADGTTDRFSVLARLDTPIDVDYYHNGGILQTVLNGMA